MIVFYTILIVVLLLVFFVGRQAIVRHASFRLTDVFFTRYCFYFFVSFLCIVLLSPYLMKLLFKSESIKPLEALSLIAGFSILLILPVLLSIAKSLKIGGNEVELPGIDPKNYGPDSGQMGIPPKNPPNEDTSLIPLIPLDFYFHDIGIALHKAEKDKEAIGFFEQCIEVAENIKREKNILALFYCDVAISYKEMGKTDNSYWIKAKDYAIKSTELDADITLAWFVLAMARFKLNENAEALRNLKTAYKLNKDVINWIERQGNLEYFESYGISKIKEELLKG